MVGYEGISLVTDKDKRKPAAYKPYPDPQDAHRNGNTEAKLEALKVFRWVLCRR